MRNAKAELEKRIRRLHKEGKRILAIGRTLGVGTSTVQRALKPRHTAR
jgi:hypothetical protein